MITFSVLLIVCVGLLAFALLLAAASYRRGFDEAASLAELTDEDTVLDGQLLKRVEALIAPTSEDRVHVSRAQAVCQESADLLDHVADLLDCGKLAFTVALPTASRSKKREALRLAAALKLAQEQAHGLASLVYDRSSEMRRVKVAHQRGTLRVSLYEHQALSAENACKPIREGGGINISPEVG